MSNTFTLRLFSCIVILISTVTVSIARVQQLTPIEAMVLREQQQRSFYTVQNLWTADLNVPKDLASEYVTEAYYLSLDESALRELANAKHPYLSFKIDIGVDQFDLQLVRYENYDENFRVEAVNGDKVRVVDYKSGVHYRGIISDRTGSMAAISIFEHGIYGIFSIPNLGGNFVLAPNTMIAQGEVSTRYILYNDAAIINTTPPSCATDQLPVIKDPARDIADMSRSVYGTCKDLTVYYQADFRTYQSFNNDVNAVADYISFAHNVAAVIYANEEIYFSIKIIRVNEGNDAYWGLATNSSLNFLDKFGDLTRNELYGANVGVLLSTKGGNMGGVAWLDALCLNYRFSDNKHVGPYAFCNITRDTKNPFPTYSWDAEMITHEVGHLVGSPHTHSCSWPGGPIDGCRPPEGNCASSYPSFPPGGGTIMSYCHMGGSISFTKGFGPLPGDLIRNNMRYRKSCVSEYLVNTPTNETGVSLVANRECTDAGGVTYYYNDNNTADKSDDKVVMKIKKNGNNIGDMKNLAFNVSTTTLNDLGSNKGVRITFPAGTPNIREMAFTTQRYYSLRPVNSAQSLMEFLLPFTGTDTADLLGSLNEDRRTDFEQIYVYAIRKANVDANPASGLSSLSSNDLKVYGHGSEATSERWAVAGADDGYYARFLSNSFYGGALFVTTHFRTSVEEKALAQAIRIYPNPATDYWNLATPSTIGESINFVLYSSDGRVVMSQTLQAGSVNKINAAHLPSGIYYFRINSSTEVYNGTLERL